MVVDESVLFREVGGPEVMAAQMRRLLDLMKMPHVVLRVLPFTAGLRRAHMDHFMLLEIPDDLGSDLVYIEGHAGETFLESESDVDLYRNVFDDALARSLDAGASRDAVRDGAARFAPPGRLPKVIEFRVSSFCSFGNCVEVGRNDEGAVLVRDTKDRAQQALAFTDEEWAAFVAGVKAGEFDFA